MLLLKVLELIPIVQWTEPTIPQFCVNKKNRIMSNTMIIKEEVQFKASAEKVWDLVINPEMTKQYMFGCEVLSDWTIGSEVLWKGKTENGEQVIYVKGTVLEYQEKKIVASTTFDPNIGMEDIPANHVRLCFEINENDRGTLLTITQGDFTGAEDGEKRYLESKGGWKEMVIPIMKQLMGE